MAFYYGPDYVPQFSRKNERLIDITADVFELTDPKPKQISVRNPFGLFELPGEIPTTTSKTSHQGQQQSFTVKKASDTGLPKLLTIKPDIDVDKENQYIDACAAGIRENYEVIMKHLKDWDDTMINVLEYILIRGGKDIFNLD